MFDFREYYNELNEKSISEYKSNLEKIRNILNCSSNCQCGKSKFGKFFNITANFILKMVKLEEELSEEYFNNKSFEELLKENHDIYEDITGENYNKSYANPAYAVEVFGEDLGQLMSYFYLKYRAYVKYAFQHRIFNMNEDNKLFIEAFEYVKNNEVNYEELKEIITRDVNENLEFKMELSLKEKFDPVISYYVDMIMNEDLTDLRYMFKYGNYISDNEIKTAEFLMKYNPEKTAKIAETYTEGFRKGFERDNKDISKKSNAKIIFNIGQELIIREAIKNFKEMGLNTIIDTVDSTNPNKQNEYDHRFDSALFITEEHVNLRLETIEKVAEKIKDTLYGYAGPAVIEKFGEIPFSPESKKECLKLNEEQLESFNKLRGTTQRILTKFMPRSEYSFTIIAFPVPEIGEKFEEIFEATCEVNMLDSDKYERIQQYIIDALDQGEYVHVKGKGSNETDIMVKMQEIKNPEKETNFVNCVADVNIPVGEVFTSPQLTETNGVLHVEEVYLDDLKYENLKIKFKDGYTEEYTCTNFENEEDNKKYVQENLLFPHKKLPLGEFAIGTNTTAYVMANKYNIVNILPILIVEKMGPHFAIGDTCFSWEEDTAVYNPLDGKEIIARDNEKSILRKTDIKEAYTQCHTDITLPYDGLDFISVIKKNGEKIDIIRDGRFVLDGTEELNEPFEK